MDLFSAQQSEENSPLAYRMRPRILEEYCGQRHIIGPGRLLRRVIQADRLSSLIFYGPPGCGKTALARVIAGTTKSAFDTLNAVLSGVKELRESIAAAKQRKELYDKRTILFVDEVHRWNKAQQDALLPWVENGTIILIGATTENPFFEVNSALVSRSRVFQLKPLDREDLLAVARQALADRDRGYGKWEIHFDEGALDHLIDVASGDARSLLNALELAVETSVTPFPPEEGTVINVNTETAEESIQQKVVLYDKEGDYHFDVASAFIKSIRGSDPDAALYWMAKMIRAGENPRFIFRRLLISACEDIGMANPQALGVVEAAAASFDRVGMPEGRFHLTHAALYLATSPKSNSAFAFFDALNAVEEDVRAEVPNHLRDANRDKEGFGHGEGYLYPHAYRDHWVEQNYLPEAARGRIFYRPTDQGYEKQIQSDVQQKREAQIALALEAESSEILSFSREDHREQRWIDRLNTRATANLGHIREQIFEAAGVARHELVLDMSADDGLLVWEAARRAPEGGVWGRCGSQEAIERLEAFGQALQKDSRPRFFLSQPGDFHSQIPKEIRFEVIIGRNLFLRSDKAGQADLFTKLSSTLQEQGRLILSETVPRLGMRLSQAIGQCIDLEDREEIQLIEALHGAEQRIYEEGSTPATAWTVEDLKTSAEAAGFSRIETQLLPLREERRISERELKAWFRPTIEGGYYQSLNQDALMEPEVVEKRCLHVLTNRDIQWSRTAVLLNGRIVEQG